MLAKLKRTKRRSVQIVLQRQGKAELTLIDPEYDLAVQRFLALEKQFKTILSKLKESRRVTERYVAVHAALGTYISIPFSNSRSDKTHDAFKAANALAKQHDPVSRSCVATLQKQAIEKLEALLENYFPEKKRLITEQAGLRVDVESYRRRVKSLESKTTSKNEDALLKVVSKLEDSQRLYYEKTNSLKAELKGLYEQRDQHMESIYAAFIASQMELHGFIYHKLQEVSDTDASAGQLIAQARVSIQELISRGGPDQEVPKPKEKLFSRLQGWGLNKGEEGILSVASPVQSQGRFSSSTQGLLSPQSVNSGIMSHSHQEDSHFSSEPFTGYTNSHTGSTSKEAVGFQSPASGEQSGACSPSSSVDSSSTMPQNNRLSSISPQEASPVYPIADKTRYMEVDTSKKDESGSPRISNVLETVIAAFPFTSDDCADLSFQKGDVINIIEKIDEGWWKGELNGRSGLVPVNYLLIVNH